MAVFRLEYPLVDGYVDNWLVAGPQAEAVTDVERYEEEDDIGLAVARAYYQRVSDVDEAPIEQGRFQAGDKEHRWQYYRCQEDHCVDLSSTLPALTYLRAWAYAQIVAPEAQSATMVLSVFGPADLWVNGQHVQRLERFSRPEPYTESVPVDLKAGPNEILLRFEQVALRDCPYAVSCRVAGLPASEPVDPTRLLDRRAAFTPTEGGNTWDRTQVLLPTESAYTQRFQMLERLFDQAVVEHRVHYKGNQIVVRWPSDLEARVQYAGQVQDTQRRVYVEMLPEAQPDKTSDVGHPARLWERAYDVVLRPRPEEWYEYKTRYERRIPIQVLDTEYSDELYGTYGQRRTEVLEYAAKRGPDVYAEIAKMAQGQWTEVDGERVEAALEQISGREAGSSAGLLGLLGALYRYSDDPAFPEELRPEMEARCLGFDYGPESSGLYGLSTGGEGDLILMHACELLAGQLYSERNFSASGQMGKWHRRRADERVLAWLGQRGRYGFEEWDSGVTFEQIVVALSHLAELAENETIQELAAVVLDKLLLSVALNSFKGTFGATQGRTGGVPVTSGQLQATAGITRLLWGMGVWNRHVMGAVSLACSEYEMPLIVADVAVNLKNEMWHREHHGSAESGVDKVTYRTSSSMLCSAQDYRPGHMGSEEHIWQATLGPDAVVFVNHPAAMTESDGRRPNRWAGNGVLPRVAQYKDTLIAVHNLPEAEEGTLEQSCMTHAYLPVHEFDEYALRDGWCFVRKGSAFLALTAAQGIELVTRGSSNYREVRSYGAQNVWLCHLGLWTEHGDFRTFQRKVLALDLEWGAQSARCTTLRGDQLAFAWEGAFTVNGDEQQLSGFKQYEGPYCDVELGAAEMEVRTADYAMTLHFEEG
jgi:hypothetical protein